MKLNTQILEEAAEWLIELSAGDPDARTRQQFDTWLRTSPEHLRAYLELLPVWEDGALLPAPGNMTVDELISMGRRADSNVIALSSRTEVKRTEAAPRRRSAFVVVATCLVIAFVAGGFAWLRATQGVYATDIGEQRSLVLADGSTLSLNARSKVRVRFDAERRRIDLLEGQALFHVSKDEARPFIVDIDDTQVRAVGTQFDVNRSRRGTVVTVVEGAVAVSGSSEQSAPPQAVTAGEQVTVSESVIPAATRANVATATAWTQRRLVFDASTLGEVVEEFNRYNTRRLILRDRALESFPITAAFSSPDPASLVRFLEAQPTLHVESGRDEIEISSRP